MPMSIALFLKKEKKINNAEEESIILTSSLWAFYWRIHHHQKFPIVSSACTWSGDMALTARSETKQQKYASGLLWKTMSMLAVFQTCLER